MSEEAKVLEESNGVLDEFARFEHFSKVLLDAYVLLDPHGKILKANTMFCQLVGIKSRQLLKLDSFEDVVQFSIAEEALHLSHILGNDSPTRIDEVTGVVKDKEGSFNLILGVYPLISSQTNEKLGVFLLIRDVTAETKLQGQYKDKAIQSITDPLTGLFTRAYFEEYLTGQVARMEALAEEERFALSLVMCDIDFFKKINDKYGHQAGDFVIRQVCRIMKQQFRKTDICCRYGGEEFLVILPAATVENAAIAANKMREAIEHEVFVFEGTQIPVTLSCGVGTIQIGKETYTETMARADQALYESKHSGRNKVSIHDGTKIIVT